MGIRAIRSSYVRNNLALVVAHFEDSQKLRAEASGHQLAGNWPVASRLESIPIDFLVFQKAARHGHRESGQELRIRTAFVLDDFQARADDERSGTGTAICIGGLPAKGTRRDVRW